MALDKQRILSELGSVMNQLQSADCGCMGKMFSNPGQGCAGGGCGRGCCCGHGYGANYNTPGGGEPYAMNAYAMQGGGMPEGGMQGGGMSGGGMSGGGMSGGGMSGGGMQGGGMSGGGMHGGGMAGGGMHGGGMAVGGMQSGGVPEGGMQESSMAGGGMFGGGMTVGNMQGGGVQGGNMLGDGMQGGGMLGGGMQGGGMPGSVMPGGGMPGGGMPGGGMQGGGMPAMRGMASMGRHAPKLYADTYNYLSQNLMQPTIKEVYNDLATITPQNTIGQNPLAAQMGISAPGNAGNPMMQTNAGPAGGQMPGNGMQDMSGNSAAMGGQMATGGAENPMQNMAGAPSSTPGQMGVAPPGGPGNVGMSQGNPGAMMQNPTVQYVTQDNMYTANANPPTAMTGNAGQNMNPNAQQPNYMNANPATQQLANSNPFGQQSTGMNNMFPGATQGGLNFDPMAIAIQMNPANQQRVAMETMKKIMTNNKDLSSGMMQPALAGANAAAGAIAQNNVVSQNQQQLTPNQQNVDLTGQVNDQQLMQGQQPGSVIQPNQQFAYTALTGSPAMNQQIPQQQIQGQQYQQVQQQIDPNTGAVITPGYEGSMADPNAQLQQQYPHGTGQMPGQEPVYAADTRNSTAAYMAPKFPTGPFGNYQAQGGYNVKNTMSKTALAANRPIGSTASRSQLQHIYRQYKASHSATQQNIRPPPVQGGSLSEGHLHATHMNANPPIQVPVEKVGGDTYANNPVGGQPMAKVEPVVGQVGNVPATNMPQGGDTMMNQSPGALLQKRGRNGMQDLAYTPYRASTAWSFHG